MHNYITTWSSNFNTFIEQR